MAIIPILRCRSLEAALAFYTGRLGFTRVDANDGTTDPGVAFVALGDGHLVLSSFPGDGGARQAVIVTTDDADAEWARLLARGWRPSAEKVGVSPVHAGPLDQSWGTREFYVDDPDGHTLRFTQWERHGA